MAYKEFTFSTMLAMAGTAISMFLGGWDIAVQLLIYCMVMDYATGVLGAFKSHTVNSEVMFWGGVRKAIIFIVIALAVLLDQMIGNNTPIFRTMALYFYVGREGLSLIENIGILGVPLPGILKKTLEQLQEKGDVKQNDNY